MLRRVRRRVARALRRGLLVVGVALTLWIPASYFVVFVAASSRHGLAAFEGGVAVQVGRGEVHPSFLGTPELGIRALPDRGRPVWGVIDAVLFTVGGTVGLRGTNFALKVYMIPLLPVAFACLAWPVTSFVVARRRRRRRGFPVEPVAKQAG